MIHYRVVIQKNYFESELVIEQKYYEANKQITVSSKNRNARKSIWKFRPICLLISSSCSVLFKLMWMLPVWNWTRFTGVQQSPKWPLQPKQCPVAINLTGRPDEREDQTWLFPLWWRTRTAFPSTAARPSPARRTQPPGLAPGSDACSSSQSSGSLLECTTRRKFSANIGKRWRVTDDNSSGNRLFLSPRHFMGIYLTQCIPKPLLIRWGNSSLQRPNKSQKVVEMGFQPQRCDNFHLKNEQKCF